MDPARQSISQPPESGHPMDPVVTTGTSASNAPKPVLRPARPFLKWAGGKRQLLPALRPFYPRRFRAYHEPFVGSGAVFFDLANAGRLQGHRVRLADVNPDLIGCWKRLRDEPEALIKHLDDLARGHRAAPAAHYLRVRDRQFNPARERIRNGTGPRSDAYTAKLAAMFIYLNRTGFNGLFRVNGQGRFNVPQGRYANPRICDEPNLRRVAETLSELRPTIDWATYPSVLAEAREGDFVYFDPPYAPISPTAHFTSYTADRFGADDQRALQRVVIALAERGCHVLLSNSTAPEIAELYDGNREAEHAGLRARRVPARRAINSNPERRGVVMEYLITNVPKRAT